MGSINVFSVLFLNSSFYTSYEFPLKSRIFSSVNYNASLLDLFFFFFFLRATGVAYESSQARVKLELQMLAYATGIATPDP